MAAPIDDDPNRRLSPFALMVAEEVGAAMNQGKHERASEKETQLLVDGTAIAAKYLGGNALEAQSVELEQLAEVSVRAAASRVPKGYLTATAMVALALVPAVLMLTVGKI